MPNPFKGITRRILLANKIGQTKLGENISRVRGEEFVWHFASTDNLSRRTACEEDEADCIVAETDDDEGRLVSGTIDFATRCGAD